jgi:hypothetical protein
LDTDCLGCNKYRDPITYGLTSVCRCKDFYGDSENSDLCISCLVFDQNCNACEFKIDNLDQS